MKFLVLHAYSADNAGDGLLVLETLDLLNEAFPGAAVHVLALYPGSFRGVDAAIINGSIRSLKGILTQYRTCRNLNDYDLVVGVGGGYLRAGTFIELLKTAIAHGIQLYLASRRDAVPVAYLPQSIGPLRFGSRLLVANMLRRISKVYVRDDRSLKEIAVAKPIRTPDLALLSQNYAVHDTCAPHQVPVLSIRRVGGIVTPPVLQVAEILGNYDGYIQSRGSGNDDVSAMESLQPLKMLNRSELLAEGGPKRVVIAVRLHAALMALNAGHWVIHLAYERKGYGAFSDLGLDEYVHNVKNFDPDVVYRQAQRLLHNADARAAYAGAVSEARSRLRASRAHLISDLRSITDK